MHLLTNLTSSHLCEPPDSFLFLFLFPNLLLFSVTCQDIITAAFSGLPGIAEQTRLPENIDCTYLPGTSNEIRGEDGRCAFADDPQRVSSF